MKSLIDPLWLVLIVAVLGLSTKFKDRKLARVTKLVAQVSIATLIFLSTGVATLIFAKVLATETSPNSEWSPQLIFVLGGGYELGANKTLDFLGTESTRRVNSASILWKKYPKSFVVFSGQQLDTQNDRAATRHGELSSEYAVSLGLDQSRIIIESVSKNTREHPIEALKLAGTNETTKVAIVTSDFHLRRALGEFNKYFNDVAAFGTGDVTSGLSWLDFVPLATHLDENTYRIKEFIGIIVSSF